MDSQIDTQENTDRAQDTQIHQRMLLTTVVWAYSAILIFAITMCYQCHFPKFRYQGFWHFYFVGGVSVVGQILLGISLAVITLLLWALGSRKLQSIRHLEQGIAEILGKLNIWQITLIAMCSGIVEEVLFRATLQPMYGLVWTSIFFGILHFPFDRKLLFYPVFATIMGFILGYVTILNHGSITTAITAHVCINMINLCRINSRHGHKLS